MFLKGFRFDFERKCPEDIILSSIHARIYFSPAPAVPPCRIKSFTLLVRVRPDLNKPHMIPNGEVTTVVHQNGDVIVIHKLSRVYVDDAFFNI